MEENGKSQEVTASRRKLLSKLPGPRRGKEDITRVKYRPSVLFTPRQLFLEFFTPLSHLSGPVLPRYFHQCP